MASGSSSVSREKEAEMFDRLFELDGEDISWVKKRIFDRLATCKAYLGERPPQLKKALRAAEEASVIAFAEGMTNIESKINFYMAHCYRGLGMWEEAYKFYMASTVDSQDIYWLQGLQSFSRQKLEGEKNPELRRVRGSGDLRVFYSEKKKLR
ncbi:hypothetical protein J3F83DRAFT_767933 [Trichoderma novae-zelandiae]